MKTLRLIAIISGHTTRNRERLKMTLDSELLLPGQGGL